MACHTCQGLRRGRGGVGGRGGHALKGKDEPVELFAPVVGTVTPLATRP